MAKPLVLVLRAPGTNCDLETAHAFEMAGAQTERIHVNQLLDDGDVLQRFQILCLPGGFSYGDDVAAGKVLGAKIQHHLFEQLREFHADGKLLLGICNGFQVLLKSGLLFADPTSAAPATLTWNDNGRYEARWVTLQTKSDRCVFLRGVEEMFLPVAHAEGKFVTRDPEAMRQLESNGQLALRYAVPNLGRVVNPESSKDVAGKMESVDVDATLTWAARPEFAKGAAGQMESVDVDATLDWEQRPMVGWHAAESSKGEGISAKMSGNPPYSAPSSGNATEIRTAQEYSIPFPFNPNGSQGAVAGLCDPTGRAFGLMPHPERFVQPTQHPRWTRDGLQPVGDGMRIFQNAVEYFS